MGDDSYEYDPMKDGILFDSPDWRTRVEPVHLLYKDEENDDEYDSDDSVKRYYPCIRRREDEEKISPEDEQLLMEKQVEDSKGFDIDFTKFRCVFNYLPVDFDLEHSFSEPETTRELMDRLSQKSLARFNKKYTKEYEFVKVIKANYYSTAGIMFLITFQGKLLSDDVSKEFQAKVRLCSSVSDFISCDLKPEKRVHSIEAPEKDDPKKPRLTL